MPKKSTLACGCVGVVAIVYVSVPPGAPVAPHVMTSCGLESAAPKPAAPHTAILYCLYCVSPSMTFEVEVTTPAPVSVASPAGVMLHVGVPLSQAPQTCEAGFVLKLALKTAPVSVACSADAVAAPGAS